MLNVLLSLTNPSPEGIRLCIYYGVCILLIIVGLIIIAALKRKKKKEMRAEKVKKSCINAKTYAEKILDSGDNKGAHMLFGSANLLNLANLVAEAAWYAFQIVEVKKDIVMEGIANTLDGLATQVSKESEGGYIPTEEYESDVKAVIEGLDTIIAKLDTMIKNKAKNGK